jgi:SAM-dependent MidA family methyltransferase
VNGNPALIEEIRAAIERAGGRITFAQVMELALYHPQHGDYCGGEPARGPASPSPENAAASRLAATPRPRIGQAGDYFTSVSVGPLFGRILARQFRQWGIDEVTEFGGHRGQLRDDILAAAPGLKYRIVETGEPVPETLAGGVFSNELFDALPVHRVRVEQGAWREIYVGQASRLSVPGTIGDRRNACPTFGETSGPLSTPQLAEALAGLPVQLMEGYTTEVNLQALDWVTDIAGRLQRGAIVLTSDYGFERTEYFAPHHRDGHLQCYHQHTKNTDPYQHIGEQDITAHVDFTALIEHGQKLGLEPVLFTDQAHFLLRAGAAEIAEIVARDAGQPSRERNAIHQLLHSTMGRAFHVLVQRKV